MTPGQKATLVAEIEREQKKIENEIKQLEAAIRPPAQDCSLEPLTKSELIGELNHKISRLEALQNRQKKLETVLQKSKEEDFGLCESCGEPIPFERLKIIPESTRCISCQNEED